MDDPRFRPQGIVDIGAAVVGVSRSSWVAVPSSTSAEEATALMEQRRFDVLPIITGDEVRAYFTTLKWNDFSEVKKRQLAHRDVTPWDTRLRDVIRGFALENRLFYFLTASSEIVGLISVVNLNCREVAVYLFSLLVELEVKLAHLIAREVPSERIEETLRLEEGKGRKKALLDRVTADRKHGVDVPLIEYLYLSDLIRLAAREGLHSRIGYTKERFDRDLRSLLELRNIVAHPTRSLITELHTVEKLWTRIDLAEEALFALR